jgi:hypothetical protein
MPIYFTRYHSPPATTPSATSPFPCTLSSPCKLNQEHFQQLLPKNVFETYTSVHIYAVRLREQGDPNHRNQGSADNIQGALETLYEKAKELDVVRREMEGLRKELGEIKCTLKEVAKK